jgi:hypothetical protein
MERRGEELGVRILKREGAQMRVRRARDRAFLNSHFSLLTSRLAFIAALGLCGMGCAQVNRGEQVSRGEQLGVDEFLHEHLPAQAMVTTGEAYRALLLLADGEEHYNSFDARTAELERRRWVRPEWKLAREQPIDAGAVAYVVIRAVHGERGVNSLVLGSAGVGERRYALRDLEYMGLIEHRPSYRWLTGGELLDLMGRADEYMARHKLYPAEPVDLREELASRPAEG